MALKSTIYKAKLNIADMDRQVYQDFALTLACHPSETTARMMLRLLAFALYADDALQFGRGISTDDEPDLWQKSLNGDIELWIDLGLPEESRIRKACGRASHVVLLLYAERSAAVWWPKHAKALQRFKNLEVWQISDAALEQLALLAASTMALQCLIQDGVATISSDQPAQLVDIALTQLK